MKRFLEFLLEAKTRHRQPEFHQQIADDYASKPHLSLPHFAKKYGKDRSTISYIIRRMGGKVRSNHETTLARDKLYDNPRPKTKPETSRYGNTKIGPQHHDYIKSNYCHCGGNKNLRQMADDLNADEKTLKTYISKNRESLGITKPEGNN